MKKTTKSEFSSMYLLLNKYVKNIKVTWKKEERKITIERHRSEKLKKKEDEMWSLFMKNLIFFIQINPLIVKFEEEVNENIYILHKV